MTYKLNKFQEKWLKALESGEYAQCKDKLCNSRGFCCLGVACDLLGLDRGDDDFGVYAFGEELATTYAPAEVVSALRLNNEAGVIVGKHMIAGRGKYKCHSLATANDSGATFKTIAKFIRANPEAVFK